MITTRSSNVHVYALSKTQVKNAMLAGAKGIIMFSDPADYWAEGVRVRL